MASGFPGSRESSDRAVGFCLNCGPGYGEQRIGAVREAGQTLRKHLMSYLGFQASNRTEPSARVVSWGIEMRGGGAHEYVLSRNLLGWFTTPWRCATVAVSHQRGQQLLSPQACVSAVITEYQWPGGFQKSWWSSVHIRSLKRMILRSVERLAVRQWSR